MAALARPEYFGKINDSNRMLLSVCLFAQAVKMLESNGLTKMSSWVGEGPMTFRVAGLVGGLVMFLQSLFGFFDQFLSLKPLAATLSVYTLFMGFVIVMLEGQCFPQSIKKVIRSQAKFLTLVNGRGIFYIFVGTLNMAQNDFARTCVGEHPTMCVREA